MQGQEDVNVCVGVHIHVCGSACFSAGFPHAHVPLIYGGEGEIFLGTRTLWMGDFSGEECPSLPTHPLQWISHHVHASATNPRGSPHFIFTQILLCWMEDWIHSTISSAEYCCRVRLYVSST